MDGFQHNPMSNYPTKIELRHNWKIFPPKYQKSGPGKRILERAERLNDSKGEKESNEPLKVADRESQVVKEQPWFGGRIATTCG